MSSWNISRAVWISGNIERPRPADMTRSLMPKSRKGTWHHGEVCREISPSQFSVCHTYPATVPPLTHLYKASVWHWQPVLWMHPELRAEQAGISEVRPLLFFAGSAWTSYPSVRPEFLKSIQDNLFKKTNTADSWVIFLLVFCTLFMFYKCYFEQCYMLKTDHSESDAALWGYLV